MTCKSRLRQLRGLTPLVAAVLGACGGGGDGGSAPAPAPSGPDLATTITASRLGILPNQENTATVTVRNTGTVAAAGAIVTVPTVVGFTYETASCSGSGGATCPASTTVQGLASGLALPSVPSGGLLTFRLDGVTTGAVGSQATLRVTASVSGDGTAANNNAQVPLTVIAPAAATLVTSVPLPTYPNGSQPYVAFNWVNAERARCGMGQLRQDERLDQASFDHARYLATNFDNGNLSSPLTHTQNPAYPGFTGADATARAQFRGYPGGASDLIATDRSALEGYQSLFGYATYHSLNFQGANKDIGLGAALSTKLNNGFISVVNTGTQDNSSNPAQVLASQQLLAGDAVATYPCGGEVLLSRRHAQETPSPFPNVADLTTLGPPITIFVRGIQVLLISEFTLTTAGNVPIGGTLLTVQNRPGQMAQSQAAFVPDAPLPANTTFNVYIRGTNEGQRFERRFSFSTGNTP